MAKVKHWKCTVCGYVHEGPEPPAKCPVCGADRSQFVPLDTIEPGLLREIFTTFRIHPVAVHFPAGLIPTAVLFLLLAMAPNNESFAAVAFWLIAVATAVTPVSLASGLYDWRTAFGGQKAPIFTKKIGLACTLLMLGLLAVALRLAHPHLLTDGGWPRWIFLVCAAGMLGCAMLLGHYGALLAARRAQLLPTATGGAADGWPGAIVAQAADAILAADAGGTIRLWNRGAERIFGVPAAAAIGQSLDLIIPENLRQRHWEGWAAVIRSGVSRYGATEMLRVPARRGDGSRFSAEFSLVILKDAAGTITGVAAILRDVTEQWERERRLQADLAACRAPQAD